MIRIKSARALSRSARSGLRIGLGSGVLSAIIYALIVFKTSYSQTLVNTLYTYYADQYAYLPSTTFTQFQFVTLELLILVSTPMAVGIIVGPVVAVVRLETRLLGKRKTTLVAISLLTYWTTQMLFGYAVLPWAHGSALLWPWILASFFTAWPFAYLQVRHYSL